MKIKMLGLFALLGGLLLGSTGCAGYRLGSMLPPDIQTVYIPSFINETSEPLIEIECQRGLVEAVQRDGSLKIASEENADAIARIVLRNYTLEPTAYDTTRRSNVKEYRIRITARLLMTRRADDSVIVERPSVQGEGVFVVAGDLSSSKLVGLPVAARDLGNKLVQQMVEAW